MTALGTRSLVLTVGGTDFTAQISNCEITAKDADSDFVTFADAAAGGAKVWALKGTIVQDLATTSLWNYIWASPGTSVAVVVKPYGGAASATAPWYSGNVTVLVPDDTVIGGDADASTTARMTVDIEWPFDAKPTKAIV